MFCVVFLSILTIYLYNKNSKLEAYINLVENKYNIATDKSIQKKITTDFAFLRNDAFGIIFTDLPKILPNSFSLDPNFVKYFA